MRIAIVDDSPAVVDLLCEVVREAGYDPVAFSGQGCSSVSEVALAHPDAVVLDLLFSGPGSQLSGWDYLRMMRSHEVLRRVPILVCSADVVELRERREEMERDPLLITVEKPFTLEVFENALSRLTGVRALPEWDDERELVLVADHEARLVHASAAMLALLGLDLADLEARRVADIVAEGQVWTKREWQRYLAEGAWEGAVGLRTRSGEVLRAIARAEIVQGPSATWHISRMQLAPAT